MATITSAATGNWTAGGTWTGGVAPGSGDSAVIQSGHVVTVDGNITVGADPGIGSTPAIDVAGGTLTFDTSASRTLTLRGDLRMQHNASNASKILIGTSGMPVPAATIITIKFNDSASLLTGKYGFYHGNTSAPTTSGTIASATSQFLVYGAAKARATTLTAQAASAQAVLTLASTSGWQVGDDVVICTTTSTASQTERRTVLTVDSATQVTLSANLTNTHASGARVLNLTSNVIFTASNANNDYWMTARFSGAGNCVFSNVQFDNIGGQYNNGATGEITYTQGLNVNGNSITSNASYCTVTDCAFKDFTNFAIRAHATRNGFNMSGTAFFNPTVAATGVALQSSANGNTISSSYFVNLAAGLGSSFSSGSIANTDTSCEMIGCTNGYNYAAGGAMIANSPVVYACTSGVNLNSGVIANIAFNNGIFGVGPGSSQTNAIADINISSSSLVTALFDGCTLNSTQVANSANLLSGSAVKLSKISGVVTSNKTYYAYAIASQATDQLYSGTSYSYKIQPQNASNSQSIGSTVVATASSPLVVTGYIYIDSNYGASNLPTISLSGAGLTTNTWTAANLPATWQQFTVSGTPTQNTLADVTVTVRAASTANVWIGNVVVAGTAVNTGLFGYWYQALPVTPILSTGLGASDVWNVQTSQITGTGTFGAWVKKLLTVGKFLGLK